MALSGLEIYKLLPQTNCKDCGYPTCLAFAMKLAAKQAELKDCPHVSEEAAAKLAAAAAPPIRLVEVQGKAKSVAVGNETVMFRHEKTFYHKPGIFLRMKDTQAPESVQDTIDQADAFHIDYVGIDLYLDGYALEAASGDPETFRAVVEAVRGRTDRPLILIAPTPELAEAGLQPLQGEGVRPLLYAATLENWEPMGVLAKEQDIPLVIQGETLDQLVELSGNLTELGVKDLVLDPMVGGYQDSLTSLTALRRLALKGNVRPLGFPIITFPGKGERVDQTLLATQHIAKYAGFIVLEDFDPASLYALLVLRENIYTDPQKPIQVQPGVYEINDPDKDAPLMVTTNFSITYFSVANEVEASGWPAWLLVTDSEGMSVLTAWAAGKFDAERIGKDVKSFEVADKIGHQRIIIPGQVAVISGELEEELPGWEVMVGPREAVDINTYLKTMWKDGSGAGG